MMVTGLNRVRKETIGVMIVKLTYFGAEFATESDVATCF